jgi:heat shock protein HtpX
MEMCFDNPHSGFADLFSTHPAIDKRVEALIRTAGGRDPGPVALPEPGEMDQAQNAPDDAETAEPSPEPGPWEQPRPAPSPLPQPQAGWAPDPSKPNPWRT